MAILIFIFGHLNTYLYFSKMFGVSNSLDQSAFFCCISSVIAWPVNEDGEAC